MPGPRGGQKTFVQLIPQLFLFPLIIVAVGVMGYLFFRASAEDTRTVEELLADIESGGSHARKQDMYALAVKVRDLGGADGAQVYFSDEVTRKLLALLEKKDEDPGFRTYLIAAVGRAGKPELTVPVLAGIVFGDQCSPDERASAVSAIALSRSSQACEVLRKVIDTFDQPESWELRWVALAGLADARDQRALPYLHRAVEDSRRELRWSSACWLASLFGDPAGIQTLRELTSWDFLDKERGDRGRPLTAEEKERYMVQALGGLYRLEGKDLGDLLRAKAAESRSSRVKNLALELLARADSASPAGGAGAAAHPPAGDLESAAR